MAMRSRLQLKYEKKKIWGRKMLAKTIQKLLKCYIAEMLTMICNLCQRMEGGNIPSDFKMNFWRCPVIDRIF